MNPDGSGQTPLTNNMDVSGPEWSPDGTKIAFSAWRDGISDIYTMNADGSNLTNITNSPTEESEPTWSPDGTKIAFTSSRDGNPEIYTMDADGSNQIRLTNNTANDRSPTWQPIVYNFNGFYQPVDNLPTLNKAKPGKAIPVRFSLGGNKGLDVFAEGYPRSQAIPCDSTAAVDAIEETVTGNGGLSYNAITNRYEYKWATSRNWRGTCRQFEMKFKDDSVQRANFTFR
jgi:dipeptidyl aminopeptidase/acylaminoacyl peptidase